MAIALLVEPALIRRHGRIPLSSPRCGARIRSLSRPLPRPLPARCPRSGVLGTRRRWDGMPGAIAKVAPVFTTVLPRERARRVTRVTRSHMIISERGSRVLGTSSRSCPDPRGGRDACGSRRTGINDATPPRCAAQRQHSRLAGQAALPSPGSAKSRARASWRPVRPSVTATTIKGRRSPRPTPRSRAAASRRPRQDLA